MARCNDRSMARRTFVASVTSKHLRLCRRINVRRLRRTRLCPRCCYYDVQHPLLPANAFVRLAEEIRLSALLLEELYAQLYPGLLTAICRLRARFLDGSYEGCSSLIDQCLEIDIVDHRIREFEKIACKRGDGHKVPVEEHGVENGCVVKGCM